MGDLNAKEEDLGQVIYAARGTSPWGQLLLVTGLFCVGVTCLTVFHNKPLAGEGAIWLMPGAILLLGALMEGWAKRAKFYFCQEGFRRVTPRHTDEVSYSEIVGLTCYFSFVWKCVIKTSQRKWGFIGPVLAGSGFIPAVDRMTYPVARNLEEAIEKSSFVKCGLHIGLCREGMDIFGTVTPWAEIDRFERSLDCQQVVLRNGKTRAVSWTPKEENYLPVMVVAAARIKGQTVDSYFSEFSFKALQANTRAENGNAATGDMVFQFTPIVSDHQAAIKYNDKIKNRQRSKSHVLTGWLIFVVMAAMCLWFLWSTNRRLLQNEWGWLATYGAIFAGIVLAIKLSQPRLLARNLRRSHLRAQSGNGYDPLAPTEVIAGPDGIKAISRNGTREFEWRQIVRLDWHNGYLLFCTDGRIGNPQVAFFIPPSGLTGRSGEQALAAMRRLQEAAASPPPNTPEPGPEGPQQT